MSNISIQEVEHTAKLARLQFTDAEFQEFTQELGQILTFVDELNETDTTNIEPISQISGLENIGRADEKTNVSNRDKMLANAPGKAEGFLKVKQVFE